VGRNLFISNSNNQGNKKKTAGVFLFLVLFFLTETLVYFLGPFISINPDNFIIQSQIKISRNGGLKKDLLIFGDSTAATAIDPIELQRYTGLDCYNFSTIGPAIMALNFSLLDNYLQRNPAPKFIILMSAYDSLRRGLESDGVRDTLANSCFAETLKGLLAIRQLDKAYDFVLYKVFLSLLPSQYYKYEIRRLLARNITFKPFFKNRPPLHYFFQKLLRNNGNYSFLLGEDKLDDADARRQRQRNLAQDLLSNKQFVENNDFSVSRLNNYFLNKFLSEAESWNIKVFICLPPVLAEFYYSERARRYLENCRLFLRNIPFRYKGVVLLTDSYYLVTQDQDKMTDAIDHLNHQESAICTRLIAGYLSKEKR